MRVTGLGAVILLSACAGGDQADPRGTDTSSPWVYGAGDTAEPFDAEQFSADLATLVAAVGEFTPSPLQQAYGQARMHGDDSCPPENTLATDDADLIWWYGGCTATQTDTHFNGVMTGWAWNGQDLAQQSVLDLDGFFPPGFAWTGAGFEGRIDIYDEADTIDFSCSCEAVDVSGVATDGSMARLSYARGPASWDATDAGGTWLQEEDRRAKVMMSDTVDAAGMTHDTRVTATLTGPGERYRGLELTVQAQLTVQAGGVPSCSTLTAEVTVRDADTGGSTTFTASLDEAGACVACGQVEDGEACLDLADTLMTALGGH